MSTPREVEVWPCGYSATCSALNCRRGGPKILRYLDSQGGRYRQRDVCKTHVRELCFEMKVIDRKRRAE
jgi:hypothetical protein